MAKKVKKAAKKVASKRSASSRRQGVARGLALTGGPSWGSKEQSLSWALGLPGIHSAHDAIAAAKQFEAYLNGEGRAK